MEKKLSSLLSAIQFEALAADGKTPLDLNLIGATPVTDVVFDSRKVTPGALFFALPGLHVDGNRFIFNAIENGANVIVYQGEIAHDEQLKIAKSIVKRGLENIDDKDLTLPVFLKVESAQKSMAPIADAFYNHPSKKLIVIGVTGTEGKSSTVSFIWQLLRLAGHKAGFVSTVQYSLGSDAMANPEHTTTPEAPIVQKHLFEMVQNGCEFAVVESSSHGLSEKLNRLGNVAFDCGVFMNVTLEHLEFHKNFENYKSDKANLFRALDKNDHIKNVLGIEQKIEPFGIVNLEDNEFEYFKNSTKQKVFGFTTHGKAGRNATENDSSKIQLNQNLENSNFEKFNQIEYLQTSEIISKKDSIEFVIDDSNYKNSDLKNNPINNLEKNQIAIKAFLPGAFNAYNIMASLIAVSNLTKKSLTELAPLVEKLVPITGRMTTINLGQDFEVIIDYAHTPSSFETIFPPIKNRAEGKVFALFGSGGERDITKRPLQGEIAGRLCDVVVLTDEDPRGEDSVALLEDIAVGARREGKVDGQDLFIIPDRKKAIRETFKMAKKGDIVLLLGKSHENSIIYKDYALPYDEIAEAKAALLEMLK